MSCRHRHERTGLETTARFPEQQHIAGIAAKSGDVLPDPGERRDDVEQALIAGGRVLRRGQFAQI